jgi:hypothetical protein
MTHKTIYIKSDESGKTVIHTEAIDYIRDIFIIFDWEPITTGKIPDHTVCPFESVELSITDKMNETKVWSITGECLHRLADIVPLKTSSPQIVYRLPLWLSKHYISSLKQSERIYNILYFTDNLQHTLQVKTKTPNARYTVGIHSELVSHDLRRRLRTAPTDRAIDQWQENRYTTAVDSEQTVRISFPANLKHLCTDILFWADSRGCPIPIKYLRLFHRNSSDPGCVSEILAINTSQLILTHPDTNKQAGVYLYSHLPGFLDVAKLNLTWEVELFQAYHPQVTIHICPRIWNIMRSVVDHRVSLQFGTDKW